MTEPVQSFQAECARRPTIWQALAQKLGREPTNAEACEDVKRILSETHQELAEAGKLRHQRGLLP